VLQFIAAPGSNRFASEAVPTKNIAGRWAVTFTNNKPGEISVAEFEQQGNKLTGTFLNTTGDYRYLEGIVTKDTLLLSGFDGSFAFLFIAKIEDNNTITNGFFYSGAKGRQEWTATKNSKAKLPMESVAMYVKPGEERLDFSFKTWKENKWQSIVISLKVKL